ncbi:MAG: aminopeptidase P family protein [Kiritimatiellae bacterium]|nr:aminopeptidase P family protein [Kiritimatiellia bacterium]
MTPEHLKRIEKLQTSMAAANVDAIFLYSAINRHYFTGLTTSNGLLLIEQQGAPVFYTDFRYIEVANRVLKGMEIKKFKPAKEQLADYAACAKNWKTIGYEGNLTVAQFLPLQEAMSSAKWISISTMVSALRSIKSADEIDAIRRSATANDALFADLMDTFKVGMSELEMLRHFRMKLAARGLSESFSPILCAGVNAVECHHEPDATVLQPNSELLIDMGVLVDGYCSDMTRTVFFGEPTARFREIHDIVLQANQAAQAAVKPGVRCCDIDATARNIIKAHGYGDYFDHALGHSVGLEVHEQPSFSATCETLLEPGMIITNEPGIYIPGDVGVRIEDLLLVTETGCEVLSHTPHEIVIPC